VVTQYELLPVRNRGVPYCDSANVVVKGGQAQWVSRGLRHGHTVKKPATLYPVS